MKRATADDHLRRVVNRKSPRFIKSLILENIAGLSPEEIDISPGLCVICGPNGAGKTTLLRAMYASLNPVWLKDQPAVQKKIAKGKCTVCLVTDGAEEICEADFSAEQPANGEVENVSYREPSSEAPTLQRFLSETEDLSEILKTIEPRKFNSEELADISYVVGKEYTEVEIYEIEEWGDGTVPYFRVRAAGHQYSAESMGLGEFSAFVIYWWLSELAPKSILLLEEPESFISPRSQTALFDLIVKFSDKKALAVILSTHSPNIVLRTPFSNIRILVSNGDVCRAVVPDGTDIALASLGMLPNSLGIVFVEDRAASYLLEAILANFSPRLLKLFSIVRRGSWSDVIAALDGIPKDGHPFLFSGMLDGDQRSQHRASAWPLAYLPGDRSPAGMTIETAKLHRDSFASALGVDRQSLDAAIQNHAGLDEHDWPAEVAKSLGISESHVLASMARVWVALPESQSECRDVVQALKQLLPT